MIFTKKTGLDHTFTLKKVWVWVLGRTQNLQNQNPKFTKPEPTFFGCECLVQPIGFQYTDNIIKHISKVFNLS